MVARQHEPVNPRRPGWPATLGPLPSGAGEVILRPLAKRDYARWRSLRLADQSLIKQWDVTSPDTWPQRHTPAAWRQHRGMMIRAARQGLCLPFAIDVDGVFMGQTTIGGIVRGAMRSGWVGYWVSSLVSGKGVGTAAVALTVAHALGPVGLHRIEATISPHNHASRAVAEHLGMRREGLLVRYLDINGAWRDHLLYAVTAEEMPPGPDVAQALLDRWDVDGTGKREPGPSGETTEKYGS